MWIIIIVVHYKNVVVLWTDHKWTSEKKIDRDVFVRLLRFKHRKNGMTSM